MYSCIKNYFILICFTIVNKVSFFQIALGKINKQYGLSSFIPTFLKNKKTTPEMGKDFIIGEKHKLLQKTIGDINYYKLVNTETKTTDFKPCKYSFTSINLIDINKESYNYDIVITNNNFNYLCDGNIINKDFLGWYLSKFYEKLLPLNYKLSIIDDDCEMFDVEQDKSIEFNNDGYKIV